MRKITRSIVSVKVFEGNICNVLEQDDVDNYLKNFISFLEMQMKKVPLMYRSKTQVYFENRDDYYGQYSCIIIEYDRSETDEELEERTIKEQKKANEREKKDRELLKQLKEKYEQGK